MSIRRQGVPRVRQVRPKRSDRQVRHKEISCFHVPMEPTQSKRSEGNRKVESRIRHALAKGQRLENRRCSCSFFKIFSVQEQTLVLRRMQVRKGKMTRTNTVTYSRLEVFSLSPCSR